MGTDRKQLVYVGGMIFGILAIFFLNAFLVMLFLGWLHPAWPAIPALSFGKATVLLALTQTLFTRTEAKTK